MDIDDNDLRVEISRDLHQLSRVLSRLIEKAVSIKDQFDDFEDFARDYGIPLSEVEHSQIPNLSDLF